MKTVIICKNLFLQLWWSILQSQFKLPHRKWPFSSSFMLHMWGYVSEICLLSILFTRLLFVLSNNCQEDFIFSQFLSLCCHCWHLDKHPQVLEHYLPSWLNQVTPNLVVTDSSVQEKLWLIMWHILLQMFNYFKITYYIH